MRQGCIKDLCDVIAGQSPKGSAYNKDQKGIEFHQGKIAFGDLFIEPSGVWTTEITKLAKPNDILMSVRAPVGPTNLTNRQICIGRGLAAIRCKNGVMPRYILYALKRIEKQIVGNDGAVFNSINKKQIEELPVLIVPLAEQERIVSLLDTQFAKIDALKANAASQLQAAKDLFQATLKQLLTPQKGWERKMLNEVSTYYNGLTYKPTDVSDKGFLVLRSSNIQNNILSLEDQVRVSVEINEKLKIHKGDIIMCSRNGSKALIGKVAIIPEEYNDMTFGTFMMVFKGEYNPFLYYFFLSDLFKKQIWRGEATMINQITRYMLDEVYVYFPSLPEQERIAARLDSISEKVIALQANYDQTIILCNDLKQSLLKSIFA